MTSTSTGFRARHALGRSTLALACALWLAPGECVLFAAEPQAPPTPDSPDSAPAAKLPPEQLESLVAPIALYPDPLLAQTLVAATYPLEIIQLQQWMAKNPTLKDKALADAVAKQPWDPSVQTMAATPEVVKRLSDDIQWTTELGNAFLAQQSDVMDAVQRMRKKAKDNGALESNDKQKVETTTVEQKTVIVVQSTSPEVIYVPSYSPVVVYGPPIYPYPPIYYPPYPPGAAFVTFSFGVMMGAAIWGGSCCGCGWGHSNNVNINVNNNFNKVNHYGGGGGNNNWQHNPQHRGAAPYGDKATANKYGGGSQGNAAGRGPSASQQPSRSGGGASNKAGSPSASTRPSGGAGGGAGTPSASNRAAGGAGGGAGSPSASSRPAGSPSAGGGGDKVGNHSIPSSGASKSGGFGGGSGGYSGSSAKASSSRGSSSMGSRGGGGGGGGGRRR